MFKNVNSEVLTTGSSEIFQYFDKDCNLCLQDIVNRLNVFKDCDGIMRVKAKLLARVG